MILLSTLPTADQRPLDPDEFARLDALLDRTGNENAMVVEEVDGFLAALACVPDVFGEDELLAQVLGNEAVGGEPFVADPSGAGGAGTDLPGGDPSGGASQASGAESSATYAEIASLLRRHAGRVVAALDAGEFGPVLSYDDEGNADGVAWAVGFLRGVELHPDSWEAMLGEKDFDDVLDAMDSLAAVLEGDHFADALTPAERDALIDRMIGDVADIHEFFRPYREAGTTPAAMRVETVRRTAPKIGRNDPCRCGSGRKYKNCCGAH